MNICFLLGKVCSNIKFEFIVEDSNYSVAIFDLKLLNNAGIVTVKAYNENADYCYSKLQNNMLIFIQGSMKLEGVVLNKLEILEFKQ